MRLQPRTDEGPDRITERTSVALARTALVGPADIERLLSYTELPPKVCNQRIIRLGLTRGLAGDLRTLPEPRPVVFLGAEVHAAVGLGRPAPGELVFGDLEGVPMLAIPLPSGGSWYREHWRIAGALLRAAILWPHPLPVRGVRGLAEEHEALRLLAAGKSAGYVNGFLKPGRTRRGGAEHV